MSSSRRLLAPLLLIALLFAPLVHGAESESLATDHLHSRLVAATDTVQPGDTLRIGLLLEHAAGWHTYWKNPGDSGLPTRIRFEMPEGVSASAIDWPLPERQPAGGLTNFGYSHTELLPLSIEVPADFSADALEFTAKASWLICEVECIPGSGEYRLRLPVSREAAAIDPDWAAVFARAEQRQPMALTSSGARYAANENGVGIQLPLAAELAEAFSAGVEGWTLMPATPQILANADTPRLYVDNNALQIAVARSEFFASAPPRIELLLSNGERGFAFEAVLDAGLGAMANGAANGDRPAPLGLLLALAFAFVGGLVLNLMPCVFPVLSIKAMGAVESADNPAELRSHGLWYTLGVVCSVLLVAAVLLALRAGGHALGWGFQLQEPGFVAAIALLLFAMGLSFSGLYEFGASMAGIGQRLTEGGGRRSAFFTGVLACVVASPCTAPLMGTALGAALVLPAYQALLVFAALGLGLAFPMLALGYVPGLARLLPRPGVWMQTFREFLAFPIYFTALWLVWVFGQQTSMLALAALGAGLILVAFAMWLLRLAQHAQGAPLALKVLAAVSVATALALPLTMPAAPPTESQPVSALHSPWSAQRLAELRAAGTPVLVNMTADWCITCLANEQVALSSDAFAAAMRERGVTYLKGDWTRQDADITAFLESFGRSGVPLYVLYPPHGEPVVLPQLLSPALVREAIEELPPARADG
ncbi:protein-disulfide reductase DsbD family protein [Aquimonas sp.]|uniref:protein-disulfide reductase DsbD family protein n=1 Tax=Aquimonas sp. TaxID=1872588 RepID=UPI0037C1530F